MPVPTMVRSVEPIRLWLIVNVLSGSASNSGAVPSSVFPATIEFAIVKDEFRFESKTKTPPPTPVTAALPLKVLLVKLTTPETVPIPPPLASDPDVLLPLKVLLVKLRALILIYLDVVYPQTPRGGRRKI